MTEGEVEKLQLPLDLAELDSLAQQRLRKLLATDVLDPEWACGTGKYSFGLLSPQTQNRLQAERMWVRSRRGPNLRNRLVPRDAKKLR